MSAILLPPGFNSADYYVASHDPVTGGYVVVHRQHGADELPQNLAVALELMRRGEQVVLLAVVPGARSPDATRNGELWEFKRLSQAHNIPRAIEKSLSQRRGQASRFVLHIQQPHSLAQLAHGLYKAYCNSQPSQLLAVALLFPDGRLATLERAQLAAPSPEVLKRMKS